MSHLPVRMNFLSAFLLGSAAAAMLTGCGSGGTASPYVADPVVAPISAAGNTSGNWQGPLTATGGTKALGMLSGSIDQSGGTTSAGQFTTAVFRINSDCFSETPSIPSQGFIEDTAVSLNSFAVEHQYLTLTGTTSKAGTAITGTYAVHGGCSDGSVGNFSIVRYAPFTGTYTGSVAPSGHTLTITTVQADGGDGSGAFPVTATASFAGFSCFTQGTALAAADVSAISGASFQLLFTTDDRSGGQLQVTGTLSPDASTATAVTYSVIGGNCGGQSGSGTLNRS